MVFAQPPNLESVHGNAETAQTDRNGGGDESRPLFDQVRRETFGERKFTPDSPLTLLDQAREQAQAPINFYLSNPDNVTSAPKETRPVYEIPEKNRLGTFSKASTYVTHAWAYGMMGVSAGIAMTRNPFLRAGCGALMAAAGLAEANYSIHGQQLKDLQIKESVLFPKKS